jgi:hypothetical protein
MLEEIIAFKFWLLIVVECLRLIDVIVPAHGAEFFASH